MYASIGKGHIGDIISDYLSQFRAYVVPDERVIEYPWALRDEKLWEEEDVWSEDTDLVSDRVLANGSRQLSMFT